MQLQRALISGRDERGNAVGFFQCGYVYHNEFLYVVFRTSQTFGGQKIKCFKISRGGEVIDVSAASPASQSDVSISFDLVGFNFGSTEFKIGGALTHVASGFVIPVALNGYDEPLDGDFQEVLNLGIPVGIFG